MCHLEQKRWNKDETNHILLHYGIIVVLVVGCVLGVVVVDLAVVALFLRRMRMAPCALIV